MTGIPSLREPRAVAASGIRGVLFDVDGTLYSQPPLRAYMAGELAVATCRAPFRMRRTLRTIAAFRTIREELRDATDADGLIEDLQYTRAAAHLGTGADAVRDVVYEWIFTRPLPYMRRVARPGLEPLLAGLTAQGIRIGALSDYPTDAKLDALGVRSYFSVGMCTTDRSINAFKPHPRGFLVACTHWGLAPQEVLYVGDRPEIDAAGAAAAGIRCIIIGRAGRTAGGGGRDATVVRDFADIPRHVGAG